MLAADPRLIEMCGASADSSGEYAGDEQLHKSLGLVPGVVRRTDAEVPDALEHGVRIDRRGRVDGLERCLEERAAHRDETVDEVGVQSVGASNEKALPSWEAVAEDPSIDAVSIVVGNALHRPIAEALVAAGKHVLCEKPLAGSMEDARAMVELENTGNVVTAVGYTYRRHPAVAAIRNHVRNGELGELTTFHGRYWCDYACDPRGPLSWRFRGPTGSGALGDIGAHIIDMGEYLCGPMVSVSGGNLSIQIPKRPLPLGAVVGHGAAPVSNEVGEVENEDTATFTARFRSGLAATFSLSRTAFGMPNGLGFDVYGVSGRASFDFHRPAEYLFDDSQPEARTRGLRQVIVGPQMPYFRGGYPMEAPGVGIGNQEQFTYQARAFLDQIAGTPDALPPNASFADGLRSMEIIQAVVQSAQSDGAAVAVPAPPSGTTSTAPATATVPAPPA